MSRLAVPLRLLLAALAGAAALAAAVALWLWATESLLVVQRNGGDQSQSSAIDLSPRPPAEPLPVVAAQEVENVVLLIGDGMGFSHVLAARSELVGLNGRLFFERFPFTGWQTTHALESLYTDSAASASSLATGRKVPYRALSADAGGRARRTVAEAARDRGMAVGLVTDSYLWDATMAAFVAHVASRRMTDEVIRQMAYSRIDLLAGEVHESLPAEGGRTGTARRRRPASPPRY